MVHNCKIDQAVKHRISRCREGFSRMDIWKAARGTCAHSNRIDLGSGGDKDRWYWCAVLARQVALAQNCGSPAVCSRQLHWRYWIGSCTASRIASSCWMNALYHSCDGILVGSRAWSSLSGIKKFA